MDLILFRNDFCEMEMNKKSKIQRKLLNNFIQEKNKKVRMKIVK